MENLDINAKFKLIISNLSSMPPYDGNENSLLWFIERIDSMIPIFESFPVDFKILLMGNIKDKIVGNARRSLLINGNADNWPLIKKVLIDNHGEKNSVDELIDKIRSCRCNSSIEFFYNKLNTLLCRLNNALYFSTNNITEINYESNCRIALNSFKYGLPEPVKSIIISRNPANLKDAYDIIKSNGYLNYNDRLSVFNTNKNAEQNRNKINRYSNAEKLYNNNSGSGQNFENNNSNRQYNNNTSRGRYYNNTNSERLHPQQGQQRNYNVYPNSSMQSRFTSNNCISGQTNLPQSQYLNNYFAPTSNITQNNENPDHSSIEPMELGVNENCRNFQFAGEGNYPI